MVQIKKFQLKNHLQDLPKSGKVLVAPLHWGIGHATRCIPIIKQLQEQGFQPILASDGAALLVLQKVFPNLPSFELPSYKVHYTKKSFWFTLNLVLQLPKFIKTYKAERKQIKKLILKENIDAIISDNRFGVFSKKIPSIYITHQLRVKSGWTTFLTTFFHKRVISNFTTCWVPDIAGKPNLSGQLSHDIPILIPVRYIGFLSQFKKELTSLKYDVLVLLSGPEPQRSLLEDKLLLALQKTTKKACFVRGIVSEEQQVSTKGNIVIYNFLLGKDLQEKINQSELILARSGYSTVMDLAVLEKKAFFIPTPGQTEQLYIAQHLAHQKIAPFALQKDFNIEMIADLSGYSGFVLQ